MAEARFQTVARVEDIAPGTVTTVYAGEEPVALARVDDEFYATQHACLHLQGPLGEGRLDDHVLTCPWHGWQYDITTGVNLDDESERVARYEVKVENGTVLVAV